jgi:3(or 17)beta-hydroxysteroid dehydrogenase
MGLFGRKTAAPPARMISPGERLKGKVCIVTGAGAGIGAGIARALAREGGRIVVADIDPATAMQVAAALEGDGLTARAARHDAGDEAGWRELIDTTVADWGKLDVVVNNAASGFAATLDETSADDWRRIERVTAQGAFVGTKLAIAAMGDTGSIINIASIAALRGSRTALAYGAAKAAVVSLTRSAALDCAHKGKQIRVNAVAPGMIDTDGLEGVIRKVGKNNSALMAAVRSKIASSVPLGFIGHPDDIAEAVVYLASDAARYVTGQTLAVDGGFTA